MACKHLRVLGKVDEGCDEGRAVGKRDLHANTSGADVVRCEVVGQPTLRAVSRVHSTGLAP